MATASTSSPDPLLETQMLWTRYKMPIIAGILAVLLIAGGVGAYRFYSARKQAAAAAALAQAKSPDEYRRVIADYPSSGAAASAYLLSATQLHDKQQFAEANGLLEQFVNEFPEHQLVSTAQMAMAGNLGALGKTDEALTMYRRTAADHPTSYNAPLAMLAQVPLLKQKGQIDEARRVCETLLTQYRESFAAQEAAQLLRTLKPGSAAAPAAAASVPVEPAPLAGANAPAVAPSPAASVAATP